MMLMPRDATRRLEVLRAAAASPAAETEWGQPLLAAPAVHATIDATFAQLSDTEVATLADTGAQVGDFRLMTPASYVLPDGTGAPLDIRGSDTVRDPATGYVYLVRSVIDAGGLGRILTCLLRRVDPGVPA